MSDLLAIKEAGAYSINWIHIIIQSSILTLIFTFIIEVLRRKFNRELEFLKNEFTIIQTTFNNNYNFILDYYTNFHKHYRACQRVTNADIIQYEDDSTEDTEKLFMINMDKYVKELNELEPKIRLIFPDQLVLIHENSISVFNDFRGVVKTYYPDSMKPKKEIVFQFNRIDAIKKEFEKELKSYLRSEKLYQK